MSISAWPAVPTSWCCTSIAMPTCSSVEHHLGAQVLVLVHRRAPGSSPPCSAACSRGSAMPSAPSRARVPHALDRVEVVVARVLVLVEAHGVEDEELGLGAEVGGVGDAGAASGSPRPSWRRSAGRGCRLSPVTGSCTKQLMLSVLCCVNGSMTAVSGSGIRSMSDSWISWNPRIDEPSKPRPSSKTSSVELVRRDREVLHQAGQVAEAEVDDLDLFVRRAASGRRWESPRLTAFLVTLVRRERRRPGTRTQEILSANRARVECLTRA